MNYLRAEAMIGFRFVNFVPTRSLTVGADAEQIFLG